MKITHNNKTYIDAATHAGLRCWVDTKEVDAIESLRVEYPHGYRPLNVGDWAKDELILYAYDPDSWRQPADAILITDAEDHREHWPLRNTHRHPLEAVGDGGGSGPEGDHAGSGRGSQSTKQPSAAGSSPALAPNPAPQPVDGGEWPKYALARALDYGGVEFQQLCVFQDARTADLYFCPKSTLGFSGNKSLGRQFDWRCETGGADLPGLTYQWGVTPTQAAEWLRQNGHEAEAAKLEGDRFEPVGTVPVVGDVLRHGDTDFKVREIDLADRHYYECRSTAGFHRLSFRGFQDAGWRILNRRTGGNSKPANPV